MFSALTAPVHGKIRRSKIEEFLRFVGVASKCAKLLIAGGGQELDTPEFAPLVSAFSSVTALNVEPRERPKNPAVRFQVGDACAMDFPDRAFDWVFSNAVIEHVGEWEQQQAFAREIRRVARIGYFVACPNVWFPIDPHSYIPLYQFLPDRWQQSIVDRYHPGSMSRYVPVRMLSRRQMQRLFPSAETGTIGLTTALFAMERFATESLAKAV